jgi:SAM-dependent methyltransferase
MKRKDQRTNLYRIFCEAEGNQYIASEYAIEKINGLVEKFRIKRILEVGLGIGSISGILLAINRNKPDLDYTGTEANDFCLAALPQNLKEDYRKLIIYLDLAEMPADNKFDLIIIDGKDHNLKAVKNLISENGIIAIEGDRMPQQDSLQEIFPNHKYVHCISREKNKSYSPFPAAHWQGGLKIIFINPSVSQKLWWMRERISSKLKYWFRKRDKKTRLKKVRS